jgi:hypothetical protein
MGCLRHIQGLLRQQPQLGQGTEGARGGEVLRDLELIADEVPEAREQVRLVVWENLTNN